MKLQTGMIFANKFSNQQVIIDRVQYGMVIYCPIDGGTTGHIVSESTFISIIQFI